MDTQIFVNLPVTDLDRAKAFYVALGYTVNEQFTNDKAAAINISDTIHLMLLTKPFFEGFSPKPIADSTTATACINALTVGTRADVADKVARALAAGGEWTMPPTDYGWMYYQTVADPDGHLWEFMHLDLSNMPAHRAEQ